MFFFSDLNRNLPKQSQNIRGKEDSNGLQDNSGIRNTPKHLVSSDSNTILPSIILGNLISSEPSIYKEGKIFVGRILLTQYASFRFLQTHLKYLQVLVKEDQCEINLSPDKIQVKLNLSDRITAKEVRAFIDKAMLKIAHFLSQFIVLKFEMDGSRLSDFKSFSKGKMSNIFVDYETNEVLAISTKTFKDLENNLNELYIHYLERGVAETNVEVFRAFSSRFNNNQSAMINQTSSSRSEIVFSSGKHIFVRRFLMKEFYANTKINRDAKFKLYIDRCIIRGTQEAIKKFEEYFNSLLTKINVSEVQVKFFGIQEFLRSYEGQNLLKSIENGNRCIIQLKSDADKKVESLTSVSNQKTSSVDTGIKYTTESNWNFGNMKVNLIVGEINHENTDVIVNTVDNNLELRKGMLSRNILKEAGDLIQIELKSRYPKGIKVGEVAISSGGNLQCKHILHACIPFATGRNSDEITGLVIKILKEAEKMKLGSISMPAIGTGILGYQLDVAASALLEGIRLFSQSHRVTLIKLINIVIFPTDVEIAQTFRSILFRQDDLVGESKQVGLKFTDPSKDQSVAVNGLSQEVDLQIFSDNANKRRVAEQVLQEECLSAFKIEVDNDKNLQHLKPDQIKELENIGLRYGIKVGIESDQLTMQGFRSDGMLQVQRAKEKLILEAVGQHHRSLLTVMQSSIEWQYKKKNRWVSFTPLLSSELEKARKDSTTFKHVDVSGTKYNFNFAAKRVLVEKGERQTTLEIRRFDKTKDGEPLPRHWKAMSETENLKLVEIRPGSVEYDNVEAHFKLTCGGYPVKKV
ncbi:poly [ADP-ribose] polymerase 14, partial [Biomphalaria glabrata]